MQNKGRIGLVAGEAEALVINNHDNSGPNVLTVTTTVGAERVTVDASLIVDETTTLGGPIVYSGATTDSIRFESQRKITVRNDVERALEWESAAIVGVAIHSIATGTNTAVVTFVNHHVVVGDLIAISNSGFSTLDGNLFFVGDIINMTAFELYHVNTTREASVALGEGATYFSFERWQFNTLEHYKYPRFCGYRD